MQMTTTIHSPQWIINNIPSIAMGTQTQTSVETAHYEYTVAQKQLDTTANQKRGEDDTHAQSKWKPRSDSQQHPTVVEEQQQPKSWVTQTASPNHGLN